MSAQKSTTQEPVKSHVVVWRSGSALISISKVNLRQAWFMD